MKNFKNFAGNFIVMLLILSILSALVGLCYVVVTKTFSFVVNLF